MDDASLMDEYVAKNKANCLCEWLFHCYFLRGTEIITIFAAETGKPIANT